MSNAEIFVESNSAPRDKSHCIEIQYTANALKALEIQNKMIWISNRIQPNFLVCWSYVMNK